MTDLANVDRGTALVSAAEPRDFVALLKPRVMSLVIFTALVGLLRAPGDIHPVLAAASLVCIAAGAGASGALNMWWDADIDAIMTRTRRRPIPAGRVTPGEALTFGLVLSVGAVLALGLVANWLSAALLAFTIVYYVVVYTMWLKRRTAQNIVIGGAAGALPPVIGWAAASGQVSLESLLLFAIIALWTPPHFWALGLLKRDDYARAGVPMLPVVAGLETTRRSILAYSLVLAPFATLPAWLGFAGALYGAVSTLAGILLVTLAARVLQARTSPAAEAAPRQLFAYSILYLFVLFAVLLVEGTGLRGLT